MLIMSEQPQYWVKVINLAGTNIAAPLDVAGVTFTESVYVPNSNQNDAGRFSITLKDAGFDATAMHLRTLYNSLDYEQRVEIYPRGDLLGDPVFSGVITTLPSDLNGLPRIEGASVLRRLETRRVPRYWHITGNAVDAVEDLLSTYDVVFKDDFNRTTGLGANWTVTSGSWAIANNILVPGVATEVLDTAATYTAAQWNGMKISGDFRTIYENNTGWVYIPYVDANNYVRVGIAQRAVSTDEYEVVELGMKVGGVSTTIATRVTAFNDLNEWKHVDIYSIVSGTARTIIIYINGCEMIRETAAGTATFAGALRIEGTVAEWDNIILATATPKLARGAFDSTSETLDQVFNGESQLQVINWIADKLDWEYRVNPKAGAGNDEFDFGATVGYNYSAEPSLITLKEGENIVNMSKSRASDGLATILNVYGQSQDDSTANSVVANFDGIDTYGIIEGDYSDPRIIDSATARLIGESRLAVQAAGNVSLSGTILDESHLWEQNPMLGYAIIGDSIIGGRPPRARAGDLFWLKSNKLNADKQVRAISLTRSSGNPAMDVVFDYHAWRKSDTIKRLSDQLAAATRAFMARWDTQSVRLILSGTTAQTWSISLRGFYKKVGISVLSDAWGGNNVTFKIGGVDRTSALFGAASISANANATDTTYLVLSGEYAITITPSASVTVTIALRPMTLA